MTTLICHAVKSRALTLYLSSVQGFTQPPLQFGWSFANPALGPDQVQGTAFNVNPSASEIYLCYGMQFSPNNLFATVTDMGFPAVVGQTFILVAAQGTKAEFRIDELLVGAMAPRSRLAAGRRTGGLTHIALG